MKLNHASDCAVCNGPALNEGDCTCGEAYRAVVTPASIGVEDAIVTIAGEYHQDLPDSFTIAHAALEALGVPLVKIADLMPEYMQPKSAS